MQTLLRGRGVVHPFGDGWSLTDVEWGDRSSHPGILPPPGRRRSRRSVKAARIQPGNNIHRNCNQEGQPQNYLVPFLGAFSRL